MDFGDAIRSMKEGKSVRRAGWNGKNMHVYLEDMWREKIRGGVFKGETRTYAPVFVMFTAQGTHQAGWLASQPDMLANDWEVVSHE